MTTIIYSSLRLPWSSTPSHAESIYRQSSLIKTKGTIYLLPPTSSILISTFNSPPRPKTRMSSGAVALCKHFERHPPPSTSSLITSPGSTSASDAISDSTYTPQQDHHPFWTLPTGSNENKSRNASEILDDMLSTAVWKNVMLLHVGVAVYEIRNSRGYGMRWTLELKDDEVGKRGGHDADVASIENDVDDDHDGKKWVIEKVVFRGFLEPIEGLDHEL